MTIRIELSAYTSVFIYKGNAMARNKLDRQLKLAQQSQDRADRRKLYCDFLLAYGYERNEESAHLFAFSLGLLSDDRAKLVHELMSGFWLK